MNARTTKTTILLLALAGGLTTWTFAQPATPAKPPTSSTPAAHAATEKDADDEVEIKFSELPEAVRASVLKTTAEKSVKKVTRASEDGITTFEVEYTDNAVGCSLTLSASGDVMETEHGVTQDHLPAAALSALKKDFAAASFGTMHLVTKTYYEVEVVVDGKTREVEVNAAGEIAKGHGAEHASGPDDGWRQKFDVDKANLGLAGSNPFFSLKPGVIGVYHEGKSVLTVTALDETRVIDGVTTRIVEENEVKNGKPEEVSRNYFAIDKTTGDVYYFGEDVDEFDAAGKVTHPGVWHSGVNGARFGLFLPAKPRVGDKFYQEIAPGVAMDRVEVISLEETVETPSGTYKNCLHVRETTPLDTDVSHKWFAPGVGLVKDGEAKLFSRPNTSGKP